VFKVTSSQGFWRFSFFFFCHRNNTTKKKGRKEEEEEAEADGEGRTRTRSSLRHKSKEKVHLVERQILRVGRMEWRENDSHVLGEKSEKYSLP
jgi:hypothetical protein